MTPHERAAQVADGTVGASYSDLRHELLAVTSAIDAWLGAYAAARATAPEPERPPLTVKEAAAALRCSPAKVRELVHRGVLARAPAFGLATLITADSIDAARTAQTED